MQKPDFSIRDRLLNPLRWGQLAVHLLYNGTLALFFPKYWETTNIFHHGGVECVLSATSNHTLPGCASLLYQWLLSGHFRAF